MKKFTLLLMVAILACLVVAMAVGCGDRNTPQENNPTDTQTQEPYEPTEEEIQARWMQEINGKQDWDFWDNRLSVTLTKEATRAFKYYTTDDFSEVNATDVYLGITAQFESAKNAYYGLSQTSTDYHIDLDTYQTKWEIKLSENDKENVIRAIIILEHRDDVEKAEIVWQTKIIGETSVSLENWWHPMIHLSEAIALCESDTIIKVGVLDTGIDNTHSALIGKLDNSSLHRDFTTDVENGVAVTTPIDDNGHGTSVAGIITANATATGITGIAPNVRLVSLKVSNSNGVGDNIWIARAINYASSNNILLSNISIAAPSNEYIDDSVSQYNGLIVCGAGNNGMNLSVSPRYPACCPYSHIITVGAACYDSAKWGQSNSGADVDLYAPGDAVETCILGEDIFGPVEGTSMATPFVTGVVALLMAEYPTMTREQIRSHIISTITHNEGTNNWNEPLVAILNAYEALHITGTPTLYSSYNAQKHYVTYEDCTACEGTHTVKKPHTYGAWQYNNGTGHYHTCTECGYTETVAHTYAYVSQGSSEHSRTCSICGYSDNESHQLAYINLGIYQGHRRGCTKCSYTLYTEAHTWYYNNHTHINHCMKCNATAQYVPIIQNIEEPE